MPEGPEVRTIADWVSLNILNKNLIDICYNNSSRYSRKNKLVNYDKLKQMLPMKIVDIDTKGKKIFFELENTQDQLAFLVSSLMMEGHWTWENKKHSDLWFIIEDKDGKKENFYFNDSRHFGTLEIFLTADDLMERINELGPDLLKDDITIDIWKKKIKEVSSSRSKKMKKIGIFLMEQKYFCGIGNYLRAEILYASKISPHRMIDDMSEEEKELVFNCARKIIKASYLSQGATILSYRNPHGEKGSFEVVVYNKLLDPVGNKVVQEDIGDNRTTHWVPDIQK